MIDLHTHSTKSDGTYTPAELVDYAREKKLTRIALTDHDTIEGTYEALAHAQQLRDQGLCDVPVVIPGIEFSTEWNSQDIHVVGLDIDITNRDFTGRLQSFLDSREGRNRKMAAKLAEVGIAISYEGMLETFPNCVLTRAHFATYLWEYGYVRSRREAFDRYLGPGCSCYVPREKVTPVQAVQMTLDAGGIPVLAHPIIYRLPDRELDELISSLANAGLVGIEALYCTHTPEDEKRIRSFAHKYGLQISGGSDFHGENKPGLDLGIGYGSLQVPDQIWDGLNAHRTAFHD